MMFTLAKVLGRLHPLEVFFSIIKSCFFSSSSFYF
jgi:hypothetical protein